MNGRTSTDRGILPLRLILGALFISHLYWKFALLPGGWAVWWDGLVKAGYPPVVPAYVLSAEFAGALLLIPGVLTRYVALYAMPMMIGATQFWLVRKGFYFTKAGAELPLVWSALLGLQAYMGDGAYALAPSPNWRTFARGSATLVARVRSTSHAGVVAMYRINLTRSHFPAQTDDARPAFQRASGSGSRLASGGRLGEAAGHPGSSGFPTSALQRKGPLCGPSRPGGR